MSKTQVPLDQIEDNPYQPRIDTSDVESLAEQIDEHGLQQVPKARQLDDGTVQLAAGHRRVEAMCFLGAEEVPVDLQDLTDEEMLDLLTVENAARKNLTAIEQARLIQQHREAGRTNAEIGKVFGHSPSWVSNRLRLLEYPSSIQGHIHEGDLSVRQANAMQPIFEADWRAMDWPEDNSFHPETIFEKALNGRSSEDLRRDVKQFESWMRQLSGETQQEVREQEYEQTLKSDQQEDGSDQDRQTRADDGQHSSADEHASSEASSPSTDDRGSREGLSGSVRRDTDQSRSAHDKGQRDGPSRSTAPVGGDGASAPDREEVQEVIREVASTLADEIDSDVLTRHLVLLGAPNKSAIRTQVKYVLRRHVSAEDIDGRVETIRFLSDWLDELGYNVDLPEESSVGQVEPSIVDGLLYTEQDEWSDAIMDRASVASLYVAYRVAEDNQDRWRREDIAQYIHEEHGAVTEEDFPDRIWTETQDEIDRRLGTATA